MIWFSINFLSAIISNFVFESTIQSLLLVDFEIEFKVKFFIIYIAGLSLAALFIFVVRKIKLKNEKGKFDKNS